jgi:hypothetical protein
MAIQLIQMLCNLLSSKGAAEPSLKHHNVFVVLSKQTLLKINKKRIAYQINVYRLIFLILSSCLLKTEL